MVIPCATRRPNYDPIRTSRPFEMAGFLIDTIYIRYVYMYNYIYTFKMIQDIGVYISFIPVFSYNFKKEKDVSDTGKKTTTENQKVICK